ncbi:hypothetical protein [Methylobacterium dankookense]|uniref:Uncharacterized protein n=1 Tax=Methylobacterium dankookense TaxID=560405 RepID=A0A564FXF9_9HYPH|nr:hypothetical protein [Methylobacterium dankookense]GJD57362.1 hypothetical protein IFDJLNFL_3263 [Methylobacterium dankookense]VUF12682.1 hypothetical protein MTDSW087_02375 [Methylobacterium dankookense]
MTVLRAIGLAGLLLAAGAAYLGWALTSDDGYAAGGRAIKARYGFLSMPHVERQSLRKLALMKAAATCEWELNEAYWDRVYGLYVGDAHGVRAAVFDTLLEEQQRYFRADPDHSRCRAAWSRFGAQGADLPGILHLSGALAPEKAVSVVVDAEGR